MAGGLLDIYQMMTGNTGQDRIKNFVDNQLPALAEGIRKATTKEDIAKTTAPLIGAMGKAGYGPKNVELMLEKLIGPALEGLKAEEINQFRKPFSDHDSYINENRPNFQVVPQGEGTMESPQMQGLAGLMPGQPQTVPAREFNQGDALQLAAINAKYGDKNSNQGLAGMLNVQSAAQQNMAQAGAARALEANRERETQFRDSQRETLDALSRTPDAETGLSPRDIGMGAGNTGSLVQFYNNRANNAAQVPLRQSNVDLNRARGVTEGARQGELGTRSGANSALEWRRRNQPFPGTDADGNPIETVTESERFVTPVMQRAAERSIASAARDRGQTTPEEIAAIADEFGFELTGSPVVNVPKNVFGFESIDDENPVTLKGNFSLRPKGNRRTVTKGKPGEKQAAASPVARAQPKPAGRKSLDEIWGTKVR